MKQEFYLCYETDLQFAKAKYEIQQSDSSTLLSVSTTSAWL